MIPIIEQPARHLLSRLETGSPRWLIGLAGMPGSGKSTLAARLADEVNVVAESKIMMALGMDGFHLTKADLRRLPDPNEAFARRGAPWTFDARALAERLQAVRDAADRRAVPWPGFQHEVGDPVEAAYAIGPEVHIVLVEGLYLLHRIDGWDGVSRLFDERWYLDTPLDVSMERLARRHRAAWGMTRAEAELRIATNDRLNAEIVIGDREFADWRVSPSGDQVLCIP